jgi:hypothetical protein
MISHSKEGEQMSLLFCCNNTACGKIYNAKSAFILVEMWNREWHFCSGACLSEWAMMNAQEYWINYGKDEKDAEIRRGVSEGREN